MWLVLVSSEHVKGKETLSQENSQPDSELHLRDWREKA